MFSSQAGPYTLLKRIAVGGMGEIFLAQAEETSINGHSNTNHTVVLKRILPHLLSERQFIDRFVDEAHLMTQLQHRNILPVYELRHDQWGLYMVMEYLESHDLRSINRYLNQTEERWPPLFAVWVIKELCEGLAYAHQKKDLDGHDLALIHRDVSPSNILIGMQGEVKIIDFGVARAQGLIHQSVSGSLQGKLAYMSPEQARSEEIDQRSDIYSVGLTLYEMLAGIRLREGHSEAETLSLAQESRDLYLEDVWPEGDYALCELVNQSLKSDPNERFTRAGDFAQALEDWLSQNGGIEQTYLEYKTWLQQLKITKISEQQLSLDAAMELQLIGGGAKKTPSKSQGNETLSLAGVQISTLQTAEPVSSASQAGSGLLVSAEQQGFDSVLDEIIQEPELLKLINQEKGQRVSDSAIINPFRYKLILWGAVIFLIVLFSVVYWANIEQASRFDLRFEQKIDGRLEQFAIESNIEITVDGHLWEVTQEYPLKQPLELCVKHPKWHSQCEWVILDDQSWRFENAFQRERPLVIFELKKKRKNRSLTHPTSQKKFEDSSASTHKKTHSDQRGDQQVKQIVSPPKTLKNHPQLKVKKTSSTGKRFKSHKPRPAGKSSQVKAIEIQLKSIRKDSKLAILCNGSKAQYHWRGNGLIEVQEFHKKSDCMLNIPGYVDLKFRLQTTTKRLSLEPIPTGSLSLRVYPPAAQVYIDKKQVSNPVNAYKLIGQDHIVRMLYQLEDQQGKSKTIEKSWRFKLKPSQKLRKFFDLSKE